jgi:polysaccharide pyruvyl transferase WcaK-like protein
LKILLINDNSAHPNWGAQATAHAVKEILRSGIPDCEIKPLAWDWIRVDLRALKFGPLKRLRFPLDAIPHFAYPVSKLTRAVEVYPRVRDDFDWFADRWVDGSMGGPADHFVELARWADVVVYNGENNLYRNTLEGCRSIFLMFVAHTRLGKPACALNHTVHITGVRPIMKAMIETVYPLLDLVTTRELRSFHAMQELGVTNARSSADVVFALEEDPGAGARVEEWLRGSGLVDQAFACVSSSGLPTSRPRQDYDGPFTELVRRLAQTLGMPVVLMARDPSCQYLEEVARRTGSKYFGPEHHFLDLWPLLRHAKVTVTGHFHYAIIAAISGCPFVPLSVVNHKMTGLCEQLDWDRTEPFDITWLEPVIEEICREAKGLVEEGEGLRNALRERAAGLASLALESGGWVRERVEAGGSAPGAGKVDR